MIWNHSKLKIEQESFFTDTLQIKENMSLLLKRDYSSNKYRWQFLRSILRSIISFYVFVEISSTSALTFKWAFSHCALLMQAFWKAVSSVVSFECTFHTCKDLKKEESEVMTHASGIRENSRIFLQFTVGLWIVAVIKLTNCKDKFSVIHKDQRSGSVAASPPKLRRIQCFLNLRRLYHKSELQKRI